MNNDFWILLFNNLNWIAPLSITVIFSVLNIVLAIINLKMAKNQAKLQKDAFCYQLYDRRMGIYTSVQKAVSAIIQEGTVSNSLLANYLQDTRDVSFLFGEDVEEAVKQFYYLMVDLHTASEKVKYNIDTQHRSKNHEALCQRESELLKQVAKDKKCLREVFSRYISFADYATKPTKGKKISVYKMENSEEKTDV